jgi:hypothetical protein
MNFLTRTKKTARNSYECSEKCLQTKTWLSFSTLKRLKVTFMKATQKLQAQSRNPLPFIMKLEGTLPRSKASTTESCPDHDGSSTHFHTLFC